MCHETGVIRLPSGYVDSKGNTDNTMSNAVASLKEELERARQKELEAGMAKAAAADAARKAAEAPKAEGIPANIEKKLKAFEDKFYAGKTKQTGLYVGPDGKPVKKGAVPPEGSYLTTGSPNYDSDKLPNTQMSRVSGIRTMTRDGVYSIVKTSGFNKEAYSAMEKELNKAAVEWRSRIRDIDVKLRHRYYGETISRPNKQYYADMRKADSDYEKAYLKILKDGQKKAGYTFTFEKR